MHEFSLCRNLLSQVLQVAAEHQASGIKSIQLSVGPLGHITATQLSETFLTISQGTIAESARLIIDELPLRIHCRQCGHDSDADPADLFCASCSATDVQLLSSDEIVLANLELIS